MRQYTVLLGASPFNGYRSGNETVWSYRADYTAYQPMGDVWVCETGDLVIVDLNATFKPFMETIKTNAALVVLGNKEDHCITFTKVLDTNVTSPEIEIMVAQQTKPIVLTDDILGFANFNKRFNYFETTLPWEGRNISLYFDFEEQLPLARRIAQQLVAYVTHAKEDATTKLLALGNDWQEDGWEDEYGEGVPFVPLTANEFKARITLSALSIEKDGSYTVWLNDGDIFWGHAITVHYDPNEQYQWATIEG